MPQSHDHDVDHGPAVGCARHGGAWGDDPTCARCTHEDGSPRPVASPGPLGSGAHA